MNHLKLTAERLARKAIIYIRQSKPNQMLHHQESKRLQYGLDLSRFLRQPVKTQFLLNGELCHGIASTNVHA
jgi:hypothetical protein